MGIDSYKINLAEKASTIVGAPISIGAIGAKMRGFGPELILKNITVHSINPKAKDPIELKEIRVGTNLFDTVTSGQLWTSAWITLVGAKLKIIRQPDGNIVVEGLAAGDESPQWLLQGRKFTLLDSEISWQDQKNNAKPVIIKSIDLVLKNTNQQHQLTVLAQLPKQLGQSLRVSVEINGNSFKPETLQGRLYLEGKQLQLAELLAQAGVSSDVQVNTGSIDLKSWAEFGQGQIQNLSAVTQLEQAKFTRPDKSAYTIKQLKTKLHAKTTGPRWHVTCDELAFSTPSKTWPVSQLAASYVSNAEQSKQFGVSTKKLDLQELAELIHFFAPLPEAQRQQLANAQLTGVLENFSAFFDASQQTGAINTQFKKLSMTSAGDGPSLENFTGTITGTNQQGTVVLATKEANFKMAGLFREPLELKQVNGKIDWQQNKSGLVFLIKKLLADGPNLVTETNGSFMLSQTGQIISDLKTGFSSGDMSKAPSVLPVGIMSKSLVDWLDHAFISGRIPKGEFQLKGNLAKFPFVDGSGLFSVLFEAEQLNLLFHPDWPILENLRGSVLFTKNTMLIKLAEGSSDQIKIKQADISIPNLDGNSVLLVKGNVDCDFGQCLTYLRHSPLKARVEPLLSATIPQGPTDVALNLNIPLVDNTAPKVDVVAKLNQAKLNIKALDLWVRQITGAIKYTDAGIHSDAIAAKAFGRDIKIDLNRDKHGTLVSVDGSATVDELKKQFKLPLWQIAKGVLDYQLKLGLPDSASAPLQLDLQSDLSGLALDLPGDLAKTDVQKRSLAVNFDLNKKSTLPIRLSYDKKLQAALNFNITKQRMDSGHVVIGNGEAKMPNEPGLFVDINRNPLALQDLLGLAAAQGSGDVNNSDIRKISIHSDNALWKGTELGNFDLQLKPEGAYWLGELDSRFAIGKLRIPTARNDSSKWELTMQKMDLSAFTKLSSAGGIQSESIAPEKVPLFSISSAKTYWRQYDLGMLDIEAERIPGGIVFKHIDLFGNEQKLNATGDWKTGKNGAETHIHGRLDMPQAGAMFSGLGITKDIAETSGAADFLLNWQAAPYQFSLANLKGQLTLNLERGRILSIEPGFGRILGVLALAQWINRLQLDFGDIYKEGLTFNTIKGRFDIINGVAVTRNLIVDAVPAKITLTGETNLVKQTVDQVVNVSPKSADAVPIAGTIMGKISALVAKTLTGKEHEGFLFGSQYQIVGEWGKIETKPLHENDGLIKKTWNGITSFPWTQQSTPQNIK